VVAAGFQGVGEDGSLTTLGRGGSDTTAVALASALGAKKVFFYKDVEGIFNADPKIVPAAIPLSVIPYEEAAHLAFAGARVLHPRSACLAEKQGISIEIKSLTKGHPGTLVTSRKKSQEEGQELFAVTCADRIGQLTINPIKKSNYNEFPKSVFQKLAAEGISLDMINLLENCALFTVTSKEVEHAADLVRDTGCEVRIRDGCAKVSLLGGGIHGVPGIMSRIIMALAENHIPIFQSVDTFTVISVLVEGNKGPAAARAIHEAFGLGSSSP
jgi:aspartate kinase